MFNLSPEDFEMPLEKQLRMRVIEKEVDECDDRDALKENLKNCAQTLMRYQHLLTQITQRQLTAELENFDIMGVTQDKKSDAS